MNGERLKVRLLQLEQLPGSLCVVPWTRMLAVVSSHWRAVGSTPTRAAAATVEEVSLM